MSVTHPNRVPRTLPSTITIMATDNSDMDTSSPEALNLFYSRLYPFKSIYTWLNHQHAPTKLFSHREFAFSLPGDVYIRYNSFVTADELKKQVVKLNPTRFEIGPAYTHKVGHVKTVRTAP